ncbi:MAG: low molecular weight phosphotyrosine protein phosphatase [Solirubrobacteraceae bacterium]|nr:low molecular weight phosphotyrosine protein phosphatase [Solirubrobacteraceae bacterium]
MHLLFVCLGNICRSPTAEAVMRGVVEDAGMGHRITVDSAGTGDWHVGSPPDPRSVAAAARRGVALDGRGRRVDDADFSSADLILAMDRHNLEELRGRAPDDAAAARVRLLREFDPESVGTGSLEVPDPYQGGPDGFEHVLDLVDAACRGLLRAIEDGSATPTARG